MTIAMNEEDRRKTALVVDDSPVILELFKIQVSLGGYDVTTADGVGEAGKYLDREFDVAVIDGLGGMCFELYAEINARRKMIVSGSEKVVKEAERRGWEAYMKPVSLLGIIQAGEEDETKI